MLLTRGALPQTKLLKLLLPAIGKTKNVQVTSLGPLHTLSSEDVESAKRFTRFAFHLVNRKDGDDKSGKVKKNGEPAVLVVPVLKAQNIAEVRSVADLQLDFTTSLDLATFDLSQIDAEQLQGRILVRRHGYHSHALYKFESVRQDLCPNSPISNDDQAPTYLSQHLKRYGRHYSFPRHVAPDDLLDVLSLELATSPLFRVTQMTKVQNLLSPSSGQAHSNAASPVRIIVPHFYAVHPLPSALLSSILLLPSILERFDQLLLAHACNLDIFASRLSTDLVLEALTAPAAGSCFDYERLEFLGDTFLKLVATCHTFTTQLGRTEAQLHMANKAILTNVRLLEEAKRLGLEQYGVFRAFVGRKFVAPMMGEIGGELVGVRSDGQRDAVLQDDDVQAEMDVVKEKALSDMVEALIGSALLSGGTELALFVCRMLHLLPATIQKMSDFNTLLHDLKQQAVVEGWQDRISRSGLDHLQTLFAHTYRYPHLGLEAFTHPSLLASLLPSYQRLEFLGDAWLDFFIVLKIFHAHPELSPGELTAFKSVLASNAALCALGVELGLHAYIASDSAMLCETIARYVGALGGVGREQQYWTQLMGAKVEVGLPKAIADVVEASFASIVVDSGFDEDAVRRVFVRIVEPFYDRWCRWDGVRVAEIKLVVGYAFGVMRRTLAAKTRVAMPKVEVGNLVDLQNLDEDGVVQAMLSEIVVELTIGTTTIARIVALPRSVAHLQRTLSITNNIHTVQAQIAALLTRCTASNHDDESDSKIAEAVGRVDELEHLTLQLSRTLGWKVVHQSLEGSGERIYSLAELRGLILPGKERDGEQKVEERLDL